MKIFKSSTNSNYTHLCFVFLIALCGVPLLILMKLNISVYHVVIPLVILMQIYLIFRYKYMQPLLLVSIYVFVYFLYLVPYFYLNIRLSQYTLYNKPYYFSKVLLLFYMFYLGLVLSAHRKINPDRKRLIDLLDGSKNTIVSVMLTGIICIGFIYLFKQGRSVLNISSGSYAVYKENLAEGTSLGLYLLVVIFFLFLSISHKMARYSIIGILSLIFVYYCVSRGFRMALAPLFMLIFLLFFEQKWKTRILLMIALLAFLILVGLNFIKMGRQIAVNKILNENSSQSFVIAHHADILYIATAGMGLIDEQKITFFDRCLLSIVFVTETFIPPRLLPYNLRYPHIININTQTGGGGLAIMGAYMMWGGYLGVLLFGFFLGEFIRKVYISKRALPAIITIVVLFFFPRWISYDFGVILRFPTIAIILYFVLYQPWFSRKKY